MRVTVVVFPGTNCDHDVEHCFGTVMGAKVTSVWHRESDLAKPDLVVLPGGFSYGDYLRTGALAKLSPVMRSVKEYAEKGGNVLGICNGFQILCESGMLPGVLLQNKMQKFASRFVTIKVENDKTFLTNKCKSGDLIHCPVAHFDGNFFADTETIKKIEGEGMVVFRYCDANGKIENDNPEINVNGSINSIAGVTNASKNVIGLMPHPERAIEDVVGHVAGKSGMQLFAA